MFNNKKIWPRHMRAVEIGYKLFAALAELCDGNEIRMTSYVK